MVATTSSAVIDTRADESRQYISWPAVFAGNAVTGGLILVMLPLGAAGGLAMISPYAGQNYSGTTIGVASIAFVAFMYLFSISAGGYIAGRLRPRIANTSNDEVKFRDSVNGLVFWAVGMIVSAVLTFMMVTSAISTAASSVGSAVSSVASGATSVIPSVNPDYLADVLLRSDNAPTQGTPRSEADVRSEIGRIFTAAVASGQIEEADKTYLAGLIARRAGISEADAKARIDSAISRSAKIRDETIATAKAAADTAREATAQAAFWTAVMSLLAGLAAIYFAHLGGRHRDEGRYL